MMRSDTFNTHHNKLEVNDNTFALFVGMKKEINIIECVEIEEKIARKRAAMYKSDLECYRSRKKGYLETLSDFVHSTNDCTS